MATVRVLRRQDGVPQITRDDGARPAGERHFLMAIVFFVVSGFFVSGYAPFILLAGLSCSFLLGEAIMLIDALVRQRGEPAEVCELTCVSRRRS